MEKDTKTILYGNNHISNAVNCFMGKLKHIEEKYSAEFDMESNLSMTYDAFKFNYGIVGNVSELIIAEIRVAYSDCFSKEPTNESLRATES
ncbi:hypothetical protein AAIP31_002292 [Flavobacterium psychrophilum]|nr:hypothetical protein [Flavobacterium psychrophilum]